MRISIFTLLLLGLCALSCSSAQETGKTDKSDANAQLAVQARAVLRHHCARCHNGPGSEGGDFDVLDVNNLKEEFGVVLENDLESPLYEKVVNDRMPPRSIPERVPHHDGEILRKWIEAGAPEFAAPEPREFLSQLEVLTEIQKDLEEREDEDRPFIRYFTLYHRHNNPQVFGDELQVYRAGLSKAINSLSHTPRIVVPQAIAEEDLKGTLYAIDLRDYGWDTDLWDEVIRRYPYALGLTNHPDDDLREMAAEVSEMSDCQIPVIRMDWFIATATRPPLYHVLLDVPTTTDALEERLGVEIAKNFSHPNPQQIARAGFAKSGVSGQNRMVERNDSRDGMYWKSYDFLASNGRSKLTRFPLGPLNLFAPGHHPFPDQAFEHDGGEMIWRLTNGLQAYMLTDGQGNRIDEGPIGVVSDALKTSGTPAIVNGVSCMACHKHGTINFADAIRDKSAVLGEAEQFTKRLYPEHKTMDKLLDADRETFMAALEKTIGPFLKNEDGVETELDEFVEPVGEVSRWHRLGYLDLETVACELDIEDPQDLLNKVGERRFKLLGLESLTLPEGVISRAEWEAFLNNHGPSLMQQLAKELRYVPMRPL